MCGLGGAVAAAAADEGFPKGMTGGMRIDPALAFDRTHAPAPSIADFSLRPQARATASGRALSSAKARVRVALSRTAGFSREAESSATLDGVFRGARMLGSCGRSCLCLAY
jgi:hypothetical protein